MFSDDCVHNWEGQKGQHQAFVQLEPRLAKLRNATRGECSVISNHSADYGSLL